MINIKPKVFKKGLEKRSGKGFSREELKAIGLSLKKAIKLGLPIDSRRKTSHEENVKLLKTFFKNQSSKSSKK